MSAVKGGKEGGCGCLCECGGRELRRGWVRKNEGQSYVVL